MSLAYEPLDVESYKIRLISLYPGLPGSIIRCALGKESLVDLLQYTALSYCWGNELDTKEIVVNDTRLQVTASLEEALQSLRRMNVGRVWADALCINQEDKQEKSNQIRNMKQIYSKAHATLAWIGAREGDRAMAALQYLRQTATNTDMLADMSHNHAHDDAGRRRDERSATRDRSSQSSCNLNTYFEELLDLCERQYWKRRWVI